MDNKRCFIFLHLACTCKFVLDVAENHPKAEDLLGRRAFIVARSFFMLIDVQWTKLSKKLFAKHEIS